ncbi:hypothetical protein AB0O57_27840 [Streptomyces sp. NPDC091201]|uniref:hypothetical protein n=1 Tax=Streptomyces sp. NPDC091201 TaxID=3155190 RepID=UPI003418EC54
MTSVEAFLDRMINREREAFLEDARRVAEMAARIADTPPTATLTVSGEVIRLSQHVAELLCRTAKLEATT